MFSYLIKHAIENVWCSPDQDRQYRIAPCRITDRFGVLNRFNLMLRTVNTPIAGKRFHIFQIGQLQPRILGLLPGLFSRGDDTWHKLSDVMNASTLMISIYNDAGVEIPRYEAYYMFTYERDLILAIVDNSNIPINYGIDTIFMRVYTNAFFQSGRSNDLATLVYTEGGKMVNQNEILRLQGVYLEYASKPGHVTCYKNGLAVDSIALTNVSVGDIVEFVYDASVREVIEIPLASLQTFNSTLDGKYKYLVHYANQDEPVIHYHDDIDFRLLKRGDFDRYQGIYYHCNASDAVRMVTHRDYSLSVEAVASHIQSFKTALDLTALDTHDLTLQLTIRNSGYYRPLVLNNNRIFELYKLEDDKIIQAMVGVNSTVSVWEAAALEASSYTQLMRDMPSTITRELIQNAYGYNAIAKLLADMPIRTYDNSGVKQAIVPVGLQDSATVYEYDADGLLLGYHLHTNGSVYTCADIKTDRIEMFYGAGSANAPAVFGVSSVAVPQHHDYRVYQTSYENNDFGEVWVDITESSTYCVLNGILNCSQTESTGLMVRSNASFLAYDLSLVADNGLLEFTLAETNNRGNGDVQYIMPVPSGEIVLFLNDHRLIYGLDYYIDFPRIAIVNKKYLNQPASSTPQRVHVRALGFCTSDLKLQPNSYFGFIDHGVLSDNNRYDIRDDHILQITVDGKLRVRDEVQFSEETPGVSVVNALNGQPYQINTSIVPLRDLVTVGTYELAAKSQEIDKEIMDYMTLMHPDLERPAPSSIPSLYPVYSVFLSKLIFDLKAGYIPTEKINHILSNADVMEITKPYEYWLQFDPITEKNRPDLRYVDIHPHPLNTTIELDLFQYRFMTSVVQLYCKEYVELSLFLTLKPVV